MNIVLDNYTPLISYLSPASIPQIVAHIQDYLVKHPILSVETVAEIIVQSLQEHPELLNGEAIPISADSEQSIKAYIDALPFLDTYTKAEINALLLGKQDILTFDQAPTPGSSNPVTSSGIIAALSALQTALETQIGLKADSASTYTKSQVDTLLEDKADADNVYSKNTIDAKLLEVDTEIDNVNDALDEQSQQIGNVALPTTAQTLTGAIAEDNEKITNLINKDSVSLNDCVSLADLFTALKNSTNKCGYCNIGVNEQTDIQAVLTSPFNYAYILCTIVLFKGSDTLGDIAMAIAGDTFNSGRSIAVKYIMRNQNSYTQTVWTTYNAQT